MLINLTNHPSYNWTDEQLQAAHQFGEVVDYPFPIVPPEWSEAEIESNANSVVAEILSKYGTDDITVHIMGEFTLCFSLVSKFREEGIKCIASTTERIVTDLGNGQKNVIFKFVRFRSYH